MTRITDSHLEQLQTAHEFAAIIEALTEPVAINNAAARQAGVLARQIQTIIQQLAHEFTEPVNVVEPAR